MGIYPLVISHCYGKWIIYSGLSQKKNMIFHSYVELPEGNPSKLPSDFIKHGLLENTLLMTLMFLLKPQ